MKKEKHWTDRRRWKFSSLFFLDVLFFHARFVNDESRITEHNAVYEMKKLLIFNAIHFSDVSSRENSIMQLYANVRLANRNVLSCFIDHEILRHFVSSQLF